MKLSPYRKVIPFVFLLFFAQNLFAQSDQNVLILGIDGLRGDALLAAYTPNFDFFMNNGEFSYGAEVGPKTNCASSWSSILTGVSAKKHNVKSEEFKKHELEKYPHFFSSLEGTDFRSASIVNYVPIATDIECCNLISKFGRSDVSVTAKTKLLIDQDNADVIVANFNEVELAGIYNEFSSRSKDYVKSIEKTDKYFGSLLESIQAHAKANQESWMIIVFTDHGGEKKEFEKLGKLVTVSQVPQLLAFCDEQGEINITLDNHIVDLIEASNLNIVPTILDYLEIEKPEYLEGNSYMQPKMLIGTNNGDSIIN